MAIERQNRENRTITIQRISGHHPDTIRINWDGRTDQQSVETTGVCITIDPSDLREICREYGLHCIGLERCFLFTTGEKGAAPFGLKSVSFQFQKVMQTIFLECGAFVLVSVDDTIVYSQNTADHIVHLRAVLATLTKFNF